MISFPQNILALISMLLSLYFFQGSILSLFFYFKVNRALSSSSKEYLYFSAMSLGQALYSYGAWQIYSTDSIALSVVWQKIQWCAGIALFVAFVMFSLEYLELKIKRIKVLLYIPAVIFALCALFDSHFLQGTAILKSFSIFGRPYQLYEMPMGLSAKATSVWVFAFLVPLLFVWFFHLTQYRSQLRAAAVGIVFFILAGINEILVSLYYYQTPYVMEYGFFLFSLAFYFQLFGDFFSLYRENIARAKNLETLNKDSLFFINAITHDLRAPLVSIEGFASLMKEEAKTLTPEHQDYLGRIQKNVLHMENLLRSLKEFVQIGALPDSRESFAFHSLLDEVLASFELRLKGFELKKEIEEDLPPLYFSKARLVSILTNLIDNAIKYSEGGGSLYLEVKAKALKDKVLVSVRDKGPGIAEQHRSKIFQTFYRGDSSKEGSGIGLAAVKKILDHAGEEIRFENANLGGSIFHFTLPTSLVK